MSDHYDFRLACDLRADTPTQVIETLRYMTRTGDYDFNDPPSHAFFESVVYDGELYDTWRHILLCREGYTPGVFGSSLHDAYRGDRPGGQRIVVPTLDVHCYVLDDNMGTYFEMCEWLAPYSETQGFVGYLHNELTDSLLLLYFREGALATQEAQ